MGKGCLILGWGTTLSAPLSSQLAAVLAGFIFTSIVFLISREGRTHSRALGLFCAAFVVLGFDSHLFSVLSGSVNDPFCGRVWTQAVTASGLLGTGAMAIITGIIWLLPIGPLDPALDTQQMNVPGSRGAYLGIKDDLRLNGTVRTMAYGVSIGVTVLLAATIYDYLLVVTRGKVPGPWTAWTLASPALVVAIAVAVAILRSRSQEMGDRTPGVALKLATYGILIYALAGTVFIGIASNLSRHWWNPAQSWVVATSVVSGLVIPGLLIVALIHAIPRLASRTVSTGASSGAATMSLRAHAAACEAEGQVAAAIPLYLQILSDSEQPAGQDGHYAQAARANLAAAYVLAGQPASAIPLYQKIAEQAKRNNGPDHPCTVKALSNLAYASAMAARAADVKHPLGRRDRRLMPTVGPRELLAKLISAASGLFYQISPAQQEARPATCDPAHSDQVNFSSAARTGCPPPGEGKLSEDSPK
jgi:hypothetical protein